MNYISTSREARLFYLEGFQPLTEGVSKNVNKQILPAGEIIRS